MTADGLSLIRTTALGLTGLGCVAYAVAALVLGRPDPVAWYWPSALGMASGGVITAAAMLAGRSQARAATDELHRSVSHRAERQAYWLSLALFAGAAVLGAKGWVPWDAAVAALGCSMGAAFLLLFVWHDLRMR